MTATNVSLIQEQDQVKLIAGNKEVIKPSYTKTLEQFLEDTKGISVIILMLDGFAHALFLRRQNKKLTVEFKQLSEDQLLRYKNEKIAAYQKTHGIWTCSLSCAGSVLFAAAPMLGLGSSQAVLNALQSGWQIFDRGVQQVDKQYDYRDQREHTEIDFQREILRDDKTENNDRIRRAVQDEQEILSKSERITSFVIDIMRSMA